MTAYYHAAMCVYCGEAIIYDTREVTDMAAAHAKIVEHDQQCYKNPLVIRIALIEALIKQARRHRDESSDKCDALAAYGEEMMLAGEALRKHWKLEHMLGADIRKDVICWDRVSAAMPETSLAQRDAIQKAEALEQAAADFKESWPEHSGKYYWLVGASCRYRKEAEGHQ